MVGPVGRGGNRRRSSESPSRLAGVPRTASPGLSSGAGQRSDESEPWFESAPKAASLILAEINVQQVKICGGPGRTRTYDQGIHLIPDISIGSGLSHHPQPPLLQ